MSRIGIAEGGQKDLVDEVGGEFAAAAVPQHDLLVLEDGHRAGAEQRRDGSLGFLLAFLRRIGWVRHWLTICLRRACSEFGRSIGYDLVQRCRLQMPPVGVVRSARALGRHHGRAQRMLRRAQRAEGRAIVRLLDAAQNLAADADLRLERGDLGNVEELLRVVRGKLLAQAVAAAGDGADAAPLAVADLEDLADQLLRRQIADLGRGCASIGSPPPRGPLPVACTVISTPSRMSSGSNPVTTIGTW